jgi:carbonic anhydrase
LNWVEKKKIEDKNFFASLIKPQNPKYLVISCADSRVVVNEFTATEPGDVFTHRNLVNLVISTDFNCQSVLQYAVEYLKVEHILVIGHTDCGAIKAALSYDYHGLIDHWLKNIREVAEKHQKELGKYENLGHDRIVRKLIELNIRERCLNLCKSPIVQIALDSGHDLYIHGYLFQMETGFLKDLEVVQNDWSNIQEIYKYNFKK